MTKRFKIINSDKRFTFLKEILLDDGFEASFVENLNDISCDTLILPIPATRDGINISGTNFKTKDLISRVGPNVNIFCGNKESLVNINGNINIFDYSENELFLLKNAQLTSYGILNIILKSTNKALNELKILISGFGRIGKISSNFLSSLKADVYILGNKPKDEFWINYNLLKNYKISDNLNFDFIINTAPNMIFSENEIKKINKNTVFIEVASNSGIDKNACDKYNIKYILSLGIPGKYFPKEAAKIIKDSILNILNDGEK